MIVTRMHEVAAWLSREESDVPGPPAVPER